MPTFDTLESAQAEILRLNEELATATAERESYATQVSELTKSLEKSRNMCQSYFLKLNAQYNPQPQPTSDEPELTLEEFAQTLI